MKQASLYVVIVILFGCANLPQEELIGFWKSNEELTLASMNATPGVTEKAKILFEKNFFGKLVVEIREDTFRGLFEEEEDNIEAFYEYRPYEVVEKGQNYYLIESYDLLEEEYLVKKFHMEGDCYYLLVSRWEFREYFCRITQ